MARPARFETRQRDPNTIYAVALWYLPEFPKLLFAESEDHSTWYPFHRQPQNGYYPKIKRRECKSLVPPTRDHFSWQQWPQGMYHMFGIEDAYAVDFQATRFALSSEGLHRFDMTTRYLRRKNIEYIEDVLEASGDIRIVEPVNDGLSYEEVRHLSDESTFLIDPTPYIEAFSGTSMDPVKFVAALFQDACRRELSWLPLPESVFLINQQVDEHLAELPAYKAAIASQMESLKRKSISINGNLGVALRAAFFLSQTLTVGPFSFTVNKADQLVTGWTITPGK